MINNNYDHCPGHSEIENLKEWQRTQNGTLKSIEKKVDRALYWMLGLMGSTLLMVLAALITGR